MPDSSRRKEAKIVKAAPLGALPSEVRRDMQRIRDFAVLREQMIRDLTGSLRTNNLRECLIREIMLAYSENRIGRISDYERSCKSLASAPAVRTELRRLQERGAVALCPSKTDRRVTDVWPSERMVNWYATKIPEFSEKISRIFSEIFD
jgi:hypothetical protein